MIRGIRLCAVVVLALGPLLMATPAQAGSAPLLDCPGSLDGMLLDDRETVVEDGALMTTCYYDSYAWRDGEDRAAAVWAIWDEDGSSDPEGFITQAFCLGYGTPSWAPTQTWSDTHRAYVNYALHTSLHPKQEGPIDPPPFEQLAMTMLGLAEERAEACPDAAPREGSGAEPAESASPQATDPVALPTPTPTPAAVEPRSSGGGSRAVGLGLLVGGGALSLLAGGASVVTRRLGGAVPAPTPDVTLYSGDDSVRILVEGGQLQEVLGSNGTVIGYRPLGDLEAFIRQSPPWQPALGTPLRTPSGSATHIGLVAFESAPEGLITSITVGLRETPRPSMTSGPDQIGTPAGTEPRPQRVAPTAPDPGPPAGRAPTRTVPPSEPPVSPPVPVAPVAPPAPAPAPRPAPAPARAPAAPRPAFRPPVNRPPYDPSSGTPPIFRQAAFDSCAIVSTQMIYQRATGETIPENALRARSHQMSFGYRNNRASFGTSSQGVVQMLRDLGLEADRGILTLGQMQEALEAGQQLTISHRSGGGTHRVVVSGIEQRGPRTILTIDDPWTGGQVQRSDIWWGRNGIPSRTVVASGAP